ncbi:Acyl-coenzyme A synthetases/AMP-(fatty) acid ligases [hydrothermal vent metagenome]|uniref:Acyl-coenzyme A synthetases/AMP-(Fatty) acid ligases n=1 Tax=hydrothermal vent metagenome TaxID=652676 RepID=A0A3B0VJA8_9ZZZZ
MIIPGNGRYLPYNIISIIVSDTTTPAIVTHGKIYDFLEKSYISSYIFEDLNMKKAKTAEQKRLIDSEARKADWKNWGPYVSERAWGTVREDYSANGDAWGYFPHDHARSRAYRWNEDGLAGVCNRLQNICLGVALWNEQDPILKERLFGLTGPEGNHGEDVKEYYFYLDSTPTHSYMKMLYKYPQVAYPYAELLAENSRRGKVDPEFELIDALGDAFAQNRYFDIFIEYAKAGEEDILCRITAVNRATDPAPIHILPHIWYRNTWSWADDRPHSQLQASENNSVYTKCRHLGERWWHVETPHVETLHCNVSTLFTENETNLAIFNQPNATPYVKDSFHRAVVNGEWERVNPAQVGSKAAAHFQAIVPPGEQFVVQVRFSPTNHPAPFADFEAIFAQRLAEADAFYEAIHPIQLNEDERRVQRQAFAGLLWSKQFYHYSVPLWLDGDSAGMPPPAERKNGRNANWPHLYNLDVLSMPDKWEYPWYAAWDLAFHTLPLALLDPEWAKRQLILMLREWYMHPNGQIPAYEWSFSDVNPPVHAWACWRVYKITRNVTGHADTEFLEKVFHKLLLNFTWWVNRKDADGNNVFQGGFLGLDNIGVFDRSQPLPTGGHMEQADGTAWMGMFCLNMLAIALELARTKPAYEDVATKFFEHFIYIADAINGVGGSGLWDEEDGFFYDQIHLPDGRFLPLKIRSFVGLIPLYGVEILDPDLLDKLPRFRRRMAWFIKYRPKLVQHVASLTEPGENGRLLLSLVNRKQISRILQRTLDSEQFLSEYGIRSLSKEYEERPFQINLNGQTHTVRYTPAESDSHLFGGNSNWRGPIWLPVNYLLIESLQKFHHYYGESLQLPLPTGSDTAVTLKEVANELSRRLIALFLRDDGGKRPFYGGVQQFQNDPLWRDYILFYEYFHGDNGAGIGASHQTGWTALVAKLLHSTNATD